MTKQKYSIIYSQSRTSTKRRQGKTRQDETRQDKTRQDKTRQCKTRQGQIRQDKIKKLTKNIIHKCIKKVIKKPPQNGPKWVAPRGPFSIIFTPVAQDGPKCSPRPPLDAQNVPEVAQDGPHDAKDAPKMDHLTPKLPPK